MQVQNLKDVLRSTKKFHQHLSQCLSDCADENMDQRARMILEYLSGHEKILAKVIAGFEASGDAHALNTWFYQYVDKQPIVQNVHSDAPFANLNVEQIIEVVVDQHQQIIDLYRYLLSHAEIPSAKELLSSLCSLEEHEIKLMVHSANRSQDM